MSPASSPARSTSATPNFLAGRNLFINTPGAAQNVINQGEIKTPSRWQRLSDRQQRHERKHHQHTATAKPSSPPGRRSASIDSATPGVKVDITGAAGNATNLGQITADAGRIGIAGVIVRNSGTLNASSVVADGGRIFLKAAGDTLVEGGKLDATSAGGKGGQVDVLGDRVAVLNDAQIDVSGATGGGTIRVGGDYQGKNPDIQNASITYFGKDAVLKADATGVGDGGSVIVWADDTTRAYGHIYARGGANGGRGGFVETSGHRYLDVEGIGVSARGFNGAGLWLLDPNDVTIVHSVDASPNSNITGNPFQPVADTANSIVSDFTLNQAINAGVSVTLTTAATGSAGSGNVTFDGTASGAIFIDKNSNTFPTTLTISAHNDIRFLGSTTFRTLPGNANQAFNVVFNPAVGAKVRSLSGSVVNFDGQDGLVSAGFVGDISTKSWENQGTVNLSGLSYIDLNDGLYDSLFKNMAGGIVNITSSAGWSFLSSGAQSGPIENYGTINVNGTAGGSSNYTAWEARYNQFAGGVLNIGAGKVLSIQNADVISGAVNLGAAGSLRLSETHGGARSFSGTTITGPGWVDTVGGVTAFSSVSLSNAMLVNSAGDLTVPSGITSYTGNVGFAANGDLTVGSNMTTGGNVTLIAGWDGSSPLSTPITSNPGGDIQITNATVNGAAISMYAGGNISLTATTASAAIVGSGAMLVKAGGVLSLLGSTTGSFSANLNSNAGSQTIDAGSILLTGGSGGNWSYAQINANGDQQITTTAGGISLTGGSGTFYGNFAQIVHGATSGNQTINVFGGTVALTGGSASGTSLDINLRPAVCAADPGCASQSVTGAWAGITNRVGSQTLAFQNAGGVLNLTGGSNGIRNAAWISQGGTGAQTISGAPMVTLAGGASGGSNYQSTDGFHYLRNNATIFSPLGAQSLTLASLSLTSVATNAAGFGGAWITGMGQSISMAGALSLMAGNTNAGGGAVGVRSLAGQTISAGAVNLAAGGIGYDNTASVDQVGTGAYSQSLTATSLTLLGGSGNGAGGSTGDCGAPCNGFMAHNSAGVYNSGSGGQTVNVAGGAINLIAGTVGNGNKAYIQNRAAGLQTVNAAGIFLQGGDSGGMSSFGQSNVWGGSWLSNTASITSGWSGGVVGSQNIASTGAIVLAGNSGSGSGVGGAGIAATGNQTVSGVAINLAGGAGSASESWARIVSLGTQSISANSLTLQAGTTGMGNRASVTGYGQTITLSDGVLSVLGGGTTASDYSNTAEIVNYGGSGQSIVFSAAATMIVQGGLGSGHNLFGWTDCGAPCDNLSSWNAAEVRNESGFQTINFQGGGALNITAGSNGNDSFARIRNKSTGLQQILGAPTITLARGTSGGTTVWAPSLVEHPGMNVWHEMGNDAGIEADAGQTINASSITMNTGAGGGFGGLFITGHTQNIAVTGALTMGGAPGGDAINVPIGTPYGNATEFQFKAPAIIGDDSLGHSLNLSVGSLVMNGGGYGIYGGSPTLIGTYKHATNTSITSAGAISLSTAAGGVQIGSFFGNGGVLSMTASSAGMALDGAFVGTGSSGVSGSVTLIASNGPFSQAAGGRIVGHDVTIATGTGDATQPVGAVVDAVNLNASGNNLSFLGDNLATNVMLASTGAGGGIGYKTAADTHVVFATAASGNIDITSTNVPAVSIGLGTVTASGGDVTITAERAILDDNGAALNITANNISLNSTNGGTPAGLAISADTATSGNITASVAAGATNGGIDIRNTSGTPVLVILSDSASTNAGVHFHNNTSFSTLGSSLTTLNGGTARFSSGGDLTWNGGTLSVGGAGNIGLMATGTLAITAALSGGNDHIALAGETIDINNWVTTTGDLALGAGVININDAVSAQNVILGAGTLNIGNIGGSGGIHAGNHLLAVVGGDVNITGGGGGGYIKTTSGDLEMLVGGDLNISDGGHIWAGYTQMSPPYADASIAVGGDIRLNNGSYINAANDVFLDMLGPTSTLYLNDAPGNPNPSYILSSIGGLPPTTHLSFLTRNSGGIVIDGEDTIDTVVGGSGFFTVDTSTPALPGAGLEITYAQNNTGVLALLANLLGRAVDDVDPTTTPTDDNGPRKFDSAKGDKGDKGDKDGGFGADEDDKDKKKSDDGKDGKKDEKPSKKQVAQCS
jgi:hypothetical protein